MKNIKKILLLSLTVICLIPTIVFGKEQVDLYFFYGEGCAHCKKEEEFLEKAADKYPNLNIHYYEVWNNFSNSTLLNKVKRTIGSSSLGVPFTIIGERTFEGFADYYSKEMEQEILKQSKKKQTNIVKQLLTEGEIEEQPLKQPEKEDVNEKISGYKLPFLKGKEVEKIPLFITSIVIGVVDGFNPCAMWVLIFLLSVLLGVKDSKRRWILGLTFLISSALMYLLFMLGWFGIVINLTNISLIKIIIAVIAILSGLYNLYSFFTVKETGCTVIKEEKRNRLFTKIREIINKKSLFLAALGIVLLAVSVNVFELACSSGLPLLFVQILAIKEVSFINSLFYMLVYIFFFLLDDLIIFFVTMVTLKATGISSKYNRYTKIVGGLIMLIIGIVLLFN